LSRSGGQCIAEVKVAVILFELHPEHHANPLPSPSTVGWGELFDANCTNLSEIHLL
jgi:hypothetical protein